MPPPEHSIRTRVHKEASESHRDTGSKGDSRYNPGVPYMSGLFIVGNILGFTTEFSLDQIVISVTDRVCILMKLVLI